jgi:hypothetical protein
MKFRRFFPGTTLLIAVAALLFFVLGYANSGSSHQQVGSSEMVSLINHGQVKSALVNDGNQTLQFQNALQAQLEKGNLPPAPARTLSTRTSPRGSHRRRA